MKNTENTPNGTNDISRKEAVKKMGKYAALTALGTFMILNPKKAQAQSTPPESWVVIGVKTTIKRSNKRNTPMKQFFTLLATVVSTATTFA